MVDPDPLPDTRTALATVSRPGRGRHPDHPDPHSRRHDLNQANIHPDRPGVRADIAGGTVTERDHAGREHG